MTTNDHSKHQMQKLYNTILQLCLSEKNLASRVQILKLYHTPSITLSTTLNLRKVQNLRHENYSIECDFAPKHQTFLTTLDNQLPSLSRVHGFKDFLCSVHLLGSFDGQIYSLKHFHMCKFVGQRIQEDEHWRENSSNHELLTLRGVDRCVLLKMFRGQISLFYKSLLFFV